MNRKSLGSIAPASMIPLRAILACNVGQARPLVQSPATELAVPVPVEITPAIVEGDSAGVLLTPTASVTHKTTPAALAPVGQTVYDVESQGTAPEQRAPYGGNSGLFAANLVAAGCD